MCVDCMPAVQFLVGSWVGDGAQASESATVRADSDGLLSVCTAAHTKLVLGLCTLVHVSTTMQITQQYLYDTFAVYRQRPVLR